MPPSIAYKYSPDQPRDEIGRWTETGEGLPNSGGEPTLVAEAYSRGYLVADFDTGYGRRCVYKFEFGLVVVPGGIFRCHPRAFSSAVTHGRIINDN